MFWSLNEIKHLIETCMRYGHWCCRAETMNQIYLVFWCEYVCISVFIMDVCVCVSVVFCLLCFSFCFRWISNFYFCFAMVRTSQLFWISNDASPTIEGSNMDGSNQHIVMKSGSTHFGDIAIDNINEKLVFHWFVLQTYTLITCQLPLSVVHYSVIWNINHSSVWANEW